MSSRVEFHGRIEVDEADGSIALRHKDGTEQWLDLTFTKQFSGYVDENTGLNIVDNMHVIVWQDDDARHT